MNIHLREGWYWPQDDDVAFDHIKMYAPLLRWAARQCKVRGTVVQAGGNAGMYPAILASMFGRVITFEPESVNFECLRLNCEPLGNVEAHFGALGERQGTVGLKVVAGLKHGELCVNTGAFRVGGEGDIPQYAIDDMDLDSLDLLQLDVEGGELSVLKGAERTICRHSPVVMLESCNHGDDAGPFLQRLGYRRLVKGAFDHIWVRHPDGP